MAALTPGPARWAVRATTCVLTVARCRRTVWESGEPTVAPREAVLASTPLIRYNQPTNTAPLAGGHTVTLTRDVCNMLAHSCFYLEINVSNGGSLHANMPKRLRYYNQASQPNKRPLILKCRSIQCISHAMTKGW